MSVDNIPDFNDKYEDQLEDRYYGLAISNEKVIAYLDSLFQQLLESDIQFKYYQIKMKFGVARFYSTLPDALNIAIEAKINQIIRLQEDE